MGKPKARILNGKDKKKTANQIIRTPAMSPTMDRISVLTDPEPLSKTIEKMKPSTQTEQNEYEDDRNDPYRDMTPTPGT